MFKSLAAFCYRRRWPVLLTWVGLLVVLIVLSAVAGGASKTEFKLPGSESQKAFDLLKSKGFGSRTGAQAPIVFTSTSGINDPAVKSAMQAFFDKIVKNVPGTTIVSPYDPDGARQLAKDGKTAYAEMNLSDRSAEAYKPVVDQIKQYRDEVNVPGLQVELGTNLFASQSQSPSEIFGVLGAIIILLIAFGSLLAMGLPIVTALFGIGCGIALGALAENFINMPAFTSQLTAMIGIGVGIDYALFLVTRYRQGLAEGMTPEEAIKRSVDTSGRAVLFAGTTVIISLYGLFAMKLTLFNSLAIAASFGVLMTMLAALTLLPAILGFVGRNIDKLSVGRHGREENVQGSMWYRWSRMIQAHPWPALIGGLVVLVLLALPAFSIRFGFADEGNNPTSDTTRKAYDLLSAGFGPGFNGPFLLVSQSKSGSGPVDMAALQRLSQQLGQVDGVAQASPPIANSTGDAAIIQLYPTTSPQDEKTSDLVKRLRDDVIPQATASTNLIVYVGGNTPGAMDFASYSLSRLPLMMGAVLLLSFLLLMVVFRSLVVPLKAVIMNLLSIGAAFGIIVAIFQWGWGASIIGVSQKGPVEAWAPLMLYAIVFGLSMDYEVFLLSRIREEYDRTGKNNVAVADGLAATARVITAAAAIMVCVFMSFVLGPERSIKLFGTGLAVAVLIDATIVRMVLVPAAMELLGDANWWLPGWLNKVLPMVHVDSSEPEPEPALR